ncbi:hypothetical protein [Coprobacter tertius]|uniref:YD repeat (Two copies) n=1 Tax=Coprobacter tertius TaxID=2944915 RepID=A0ABT1MCZ5_9BACT|nr:hypothetical protein [Coprobacter tertius]MCP9610513.1 hypothetical protein [Coprobacter tertius]
MKTRMLTAAIVCLLALCSKSIAQDTDPISVSRPEILPTTPAAAALIRNVTYPVNYSSGLVDINIPIYEIKIGEITLPIALSYHASGFRPNSTGKSWVGEGWSLSAEPSISRSIAGQDDFDTYGYYSMGCSSKRNDVNFLYKWAKGEDDGQPDQFFYSLIDKSGSFYFSYKRDNDTRVIKTHPYQPVEITTNRFESSRFGHEFHITDENGFQYHFGRSISGNKIYMERSATSYNVLQDATDWKVISWKGTEIISPSRRDTVSFIYDEYQHMTDIDKGNDFLQIEDRSTYTGAVTGEKIYPKLTNFINNRTYINSVDVTEPSSLLNIILNEVSVGAMPEKHPIMKELMLKKISYRGGWTEFQRDAYQNLEYISVYDIAGGLLKKVRFYYSDFSDSRSKSCFLLDSIDVIDSDGKMVERYRMGYYDHSYTPLHGSLREPDHWGFWKKDLSGEPSQTMTAIAKPKERIKVSNVISGIPHDNLELTVMGDEKQAGELTCRRGVLKSIVFPTGGITQFDYEQNYYGPEKTPARLVGGLHIREIREYDPVSGKTMIKRLEYGPGSMLHIPNDYDYYYSQEIEYYVNGNRYESVRSRNYMARPKTNFLYPGGMPIMYEDITEYRLYVNGNDTVDAGKTVYNYLFYDGTYADSLLFDSTTIVIDTKNDWRRGQLVSKKMYERKGTIYNLVVSEDYKYKEMNTDSIPAGQIFQKVVRQGLTREEEDRLSKYSDHYDWRYYYIQTGCKVPESITTKQYFGNDSVVSVKSYTYYEPTTGKTPLLAPIRITTKSSEGKTIVDERKYPQTITYTGENETARQRLIQERRLTTLLQSRHYKDLETNGTTQNAYFGDFGGLLLQKSLSQKNNGNGIEEERIQFMRYDKYGNPVYIIQDGYKKVVYIWGYNYRYPIAEITNATYEEVTSIISESSLETISSNPLLLDSDVKALNLLRTYLPEANVITFTHQPGVGVTSRTEADGRTLYYDYDAAGRLICLWFKDKNGKKSVIESYRYHYMN